jgi:hypothetical protein
MNMDFRSRVLQGIFGRHEEYSIEAKKLRDL